MQKITFGDTEVVVSELGAELQSLKYKGREYLYQKAPGFWQRQSPILFPIVGKLRNDAYFYEGKAYSLFQHGFLRDMLWKEEDGEGIFSISSDEKTREKFPWDFTVQISYLLQVDGLRVEYRVTNSSDRIMPFSLGGHPAFALHGDISTYEVAFEDDEELFVRFLDTKEKGVLGEHSEKIEIGNRRLRLSEGLLQRDALIFLSLKSKIFHLLQNGERILSFSRGNFPHFALWKQPSAPFLCLEPWQGYADGVNTSGNILEKPGMKLLEIGESETYFWEVMFSQN